MIELPESYNLARQMNQELKGKRIVDSKFHTWPHKFAFYMDDYHHYPAFLKGKTIDEVRAIGGNVELQIDFLRMVLGDGLKLYYCQNEREIPEKHQLMLELEDGSYLTGSTQMYSVIQLFEDGSNDSHYYRYAIEKPNPLTEAFDEAYFQQMFEEAKPKLSAKAFLATEQRIPGLGNGVLQDILFTAGINPKLKLETISKEQAAHLYKCLKQVLTEMAEQGGRDTEKDLYGKPGGYKTLLSNKTIKEPCQVCGEWIVKQAYLGGSVYYCPRCQPL